MALGNTGKMLVADLSNGTPRVDQHDDAWYRKYMGGAALAMDCILREVRSRTDPLEPENVLVCAGGPSFVLFILLHLWVQRADVTPWGSPATGTTSTK